MQNYSAAYFINKDRPRDVGAIIKLSQEDPDSSAHSSLVMKVPCPEMAIINCW